MLWQLHGLLDELVARRRRQYGDDGLNAGACANEVTSARFGRAQRLQYRRSNDRWIEAAALLVSGYIYNGVDEFAIVLHGGWWHECDEAVLIESPLLPNGRLDGGKLKQTHMDAAWRKFLAKRVGK